MSDVKFKKLGALLQADAVGLLRQHFKVEPGMKIGEFVEGWSDEKIAEKIGAGPTFRKSVANLRANYFGHLKRTYTPGVMANTEALREALNRQAADIAALMAWATDPKLQNNPLVLDGE